MRKYKVMLNPRAYQDIEDIYRYIALEKLSPEYARKQTERIRTALSKLKEFPEAHQERLTGRYAGQGYRQLVIDDYIAIYKIHEADKIVRVITIQYKGRKL